MISRHISQMASLEAQTPVTNTKQLLGKDLLAEGSVRPLLPNMAGILAIARALIMVLATFD